MKEAPEDGVGKGAPRVILLAGPTAVGKSEVAMKLAERIGGEIVSVDSMQVYRGLDVGTAKPTQEERGRIAHHLIDILDLNEAFDASQFVKRAHQAVAEIEGRGRRPIFCGGTGLYFKAWLDGLGAAPPGDAGLRRELEQTPMEQLLNELRRLDPITHNRIDVKNRRRVVRAVEVIRLTGKPYWEQRAAWVTGPTAEGAGSAAPSFGLDRDVGDLDQRIERRIARMFRMGLVEETRRLLRLGLESNPVALQAIGYRQVAEHLAGEQDLEETMERVARRTRQFARRQRTWFERQMQLRWIRIGKDDSVEAVVERVLSAIRGG